MKALLSYTFTFFILSASIASSNEKKVACLLNVEKSNKAEIVKEKIDQSFKKIIKNIDQNPKKPIGYSAWKKLTQAWMNGDHVPSVILTNQDLNGAFDFMLQNIKDFSKELKNPKAYPFLPERHRQVALEVAEDLERSLQKANKTGVQYDETLLITERFVMLMDAKDGRRFLKPDDTYGTADPSWLSSRSKFESQAKKEASSTFLTPDEELGTIPTSLEIPVFSGNSEKGLSYDDFPDCMIYQPLEIISDKRLTDHILMSPSQSLRHDRYDHGSHLKELKQIRTNFSSVASSSLENFSDSIEYTSAIRLALDDAPPEVQRTLNATLFDINHEYSKIINPFEIENYLRTETMPIDKGITQKMKSSTLEWLKVNGFSTPEKPIIFKQTAERTLLNKGHQPWKSFHSFEAYQSFEVNKPSPLEMFPGKITKIYSDFDGKIAVEIEGIHETVKIKQVEFKTSWKQVDSR
ncbi:MAG: hypothetical protein CL678_06880 [Bdellovibrionaceae bacterium]|nr:hypothetical protein [Pseudobdellovibrionaceae bacterium]|tara:strand:+ start:3134 stop:4528 length:1395 start_codon:yes stop_codon:yes gene_type:complete